MKIETVYFPNIQREITFYIGKSQKENFEVIDNAKYDDLWFHAENDSSCHVVASIPENTDKKSLQTIIKRGALLCKQNTNKLIHCKDVPFIYTKIDHVKKTNIEGCVTTEHTKIIKC